MKSYLSNYVKNTIFVTSVLVTLVSVGATLTTTALAVPVSPSGTVQSYPSNLNGSWIVAWQINGYSMRGRLYMQGNQGTLRIRVISPDGTTRRIQETMFLRQRDWENRIVLIGSNPIDLTTNTPALDYPPDNFRVRRSPYGLATRTCDSVGTCVPVTMEYRGSDLVYPSNNGSF